MLGHACHYAIALLESRHRRADFRHDTGQLIAEDTRESKTVEDPQLALPRLVVDRIQAHRVNLNHDLIGFYPRQRDLAQLSRIGTTVAGKDQRTHLADRHLLLP